MHTRVSFLFQVTTDPQNRAAAIPHTGGWSEGWWTDFQLLPSQPFLTRYAEQRARLLPSQAAIIGCRMAYYDLSGNALLPKGSATRKFQFPGSASLHTDLPQVALEMVATSQGGPSASRFTLRCMPDDVMKRGEYDPPASFTRNMNAFMEFFVASTDHLGWIGRDLSVTTARILSIDNAGLVTLDGAAGGVAGVDYLRLYRVRDTQGAAVTGAYRIITHPTATTYTIAGWEGQTVESSGLARLDRLKYFDCNGVNISRAVVRKIGRPFASYRGKQSKRTV